MKRLFKTLLKVMLVFASLIALFVVATTIFIKTQKQFGQQPINEDLERISSSPNYKKNAFVNLIETSQGDFKAMMSTLPKFFSLKNGSPKDSLPVKFGENTLPANDSSCFVTWYGHSAFLIEMDGKRILIDPMLGEVAAPISFGASRYPYKKAIPLESLDSIDILIISHDHYDHLDYPSILALSEKVKQFYTPLGVGSHLKYWGISEDRITELDWWDEINSEGLRLVACPARHFSGRGVTDRDKTLWASWIIEGENQKLYFSGDGGYGPHFSEIGDKEGPFDLAMMECGQYNEAWGQIHMMPEESVQAGKDVNGKLIMPIHWGAFKLSVHTWTDPIERFKKASESLNIPMVHPFIGERFQLAEQYPREMWWLLSANE